MAREKQAMDSAAAKERRLVEMAQKNPDAFKHIFNKYYDTIFNYALRRTGNAHIADDVAANTFVKALAQIKNFKWQGSSISAWLYRIATNEIFQLHRKSKRTIRLSSEAKDRLQDDHSSDSALLEAEETIARNKQFRQVHAALSRLKQKYQAALTLRYFEEKSIKEIAAILDLSENTVKTHIRRGLQKLRDQL